MQQVESTFIFPIIPTFTMSQEQGQDVSGSMAKQQNVLANEEKPIQELEQQNEANEDSKNMKTKYEKNENSHNDQVDQSTIGTILRTLVPHIEGNKEEDKMSLGSELLTIDDKNRQDVSIQLPNEDKKNEEEINI